MVPIELMPIGEGMVPNAAAGIVAPGDIVVVDGVIVAVVGAVDVETVLGTIDGIGTGVMEG